MVYDANNIRSTIKIKYYYITILNYTIDIEISHESLTRAVEDDVIRNDNKNNK